MIKNILVPTDFSAGSQRALDRACELADALGASLHVMHVVEDPFAPGAFMEMYAPPPGEYFADLEVQALKRLEGCLSADQRRKHRVVLTARVGVPAQEILRRLNEAPKIDLVVMATHGRGGVARLMMGSVAGRIVQSAPCPVMTLRQLPTSGETRAA
jgi:nucleotide-binding universal stress UspA family protein